MYTLVVLVRVLVPRKLLEVVLAELTHPRVITAATGRSI